MFLEWVLKDFVNRRYILFKTFNLQPINKSSHDIQVYVDIVYNNRIIGYYVLYKNDQITFHRKNGPNVWLDRDLTLRKFLELNNINIDENDIMRAMLENI